LDSVKNWNRIYGKRGFLQYQFVIPYEHDRGAALMKILQTIQSSGMGSFLAVLKTFGDVPSRGLMSFPQKGVTLALDFPNHGQDLLKVLEWCDQIVADNGGRVYLAKDARLSRKNFEIFFPRLNEFTKYLDPQMSSTLWRRLHG
jgi:hypothetical protein